MKPWWADILTGAIYGVFGGLLVKVAGSAAWWVTLLVAAGYCVTLRYLAPRDERRHWGADALRLVRAHPMAVPSFALTLAFVALVVSALGVNPVDSVAVGFAAGVIVATAAVHGFPDPWERRA